MNIVLIGLMGSGKSSVGRALAERLGRPFVDTDEAIEAEAGCSIPEIFAAQGEAAFRRLESAVIARVAQEDGQVIATGGGAVLAEGNRLALRANGMLFWLDAPVEELYRRASAQGISARPLLSGGDALARLRALAESRAESYQQAAHYRIATEGCSASEVAAEIAVMVRRDKGDNSEWQK